MPNSNSTFSFLVVVVVTKTEREKKDNLEEASLTHIVILIFQFCGLFHSHRMTLQVIEDIKRCIQDLESEQQMAPINVQLMDSNCAFIYQNSKMAEVSNVFDVEESISSVKQMGLLMLLFILA